MTDQREAELNPNRGTARFECSRRGDRAPETDQVAQPVGRNRSGANQGGPEDSIRMKLRTDWQKSFAQPDNPVSFAKEFCTYFLIQQVAYFVYTMHYISFIHCACVSCLH